MRSLLRRRLRTVALLRWDRPLGPLAALLLLLAALPSGAAAAPPTTPATTPPARAVGSWWDRTDPGAGKRLPTSRYYALRSDLSPELTRAFGEHLDTMYDEFMRRLVQGSGLKRRSAEVLDVFIFAKQQDYLDTLRTRYGINGTGSGGMFFQSPRGAGLAFWTENLPRQRIEHVMQHEGFHQFAAAYFGNGLPPWLNEGLAEFFGESVVEGRTVVIGQASPDVVDVVKEAVARDLHIPFAEILQMDGAQWNARVRGGTAALQYMQSWSMVHFLIYGEKGKYQPYFVRMLKMINDGSAAWDAMRGAFRFASPADIDLFEKSWKQHVADSKAGAFIAARGRLEFLAEGLEQVWSKGARPKKLAELRDALREAGFKHTAVSHGYSVTLSAADDANFALPADALNPAGATIELAPAKTSKNAKERKLAEQNPVPPTIRTKGLLPKNLTVVWTRRADDPARFDYDVVIDEGK